MNKEVKEPMWVGIEIEGINTTIKMCLGLNMEDGHDLSWRMSEDEHWNYDNFKIVIKHGEDARVFDNNNNLISE
jgi:hypothetical protein